tara:strand:- start:293 stop:739 length:447 start_codon:yes stop_codon:yes gene_type:complete
MGNLEQFKKDFKDYVDAKDKYIKETISFQDDSFDTDNCISLSEEDHNDLIDTRKKLKEIIKKVLVSFNKLSEKELELLNNIKLKDIAEVKSNYNELRVNAQNQYKKFPLIKRQTKDSEILYKSIQYKTALVGVVSIMAVIVLFRISKK